MKPEERLIRDELYEVKSAIAFMEMKNRDGSKQVQLDNLKRKQKKIRLKFAKFKVEQIKEEKENEEYKRR